MRKNTAIWQQNLWVLWFGVFITGVGFSEIMPFLSLYVNELGTFSKNELTFYSNITFAITFLMTAIISPYWGKLADKYGRKVMLLRASLGMAIIIIIMAFVTNIYQLIALRALQGLFGGYISNANALIASQTPKQFSGRALSVIVTGTTAGSLIGPFIGGVIASVFSFRQSFIITGILLLIVFVLTWQFVKEDKSVMQPKKSEQLIQSFKDLPNRQFIFGLFFTTAIIQIVTTSINPIVALFVREINHEASNTTFLAGIVAAMPGIATVFAAPYFGRLGDKIGPKIILTGGFILAFLIQLPTAFVSSIIGLMILRFGIGISDSAMIPQINLLLTKNTPQNMTSRIFSYNQSFMAMGNVIGPLLSSAITPYFDYRGIFVMGAILVAINLILFTANAKKAHLTS